LIAVKGLILVGLAWGFRLPARVGAEMSMLLGPGGKFSFVMIGAALAGGLVDRALATTLAAAVAISMLAIPALAKLGQGIGSAPRPQAGAAPEETPPGDEDGRVIIVGYGRVGALIGDMLNVHKIPFIAVDSDARLVARARAAGKRVYYGDASRPNYLRGCGVETARAVVVTMDSPSGNEAVVATTRSLRQDVTLVARAATPPTPARSTSLGVTDAVPEAIEASLQLSEAVLVDIGVPMGFAIASVHEKREEYRKVLLAAGARERFRSTRKSRRA
jgi:monovalent cation:H+ antiporter-2, CPA2 family